VEEADIRPALDPEPLVETQPGPALECQVEKPVVGDGDDPFFLALADPAFVARLPCAVPVLHPAHEGGLPSRKPCGGRSRENRPAYELRVSLAVFRHQCRKPGDIGLLVVVQESEQVRPPGQGVIERAVAGEGNAGARLLDEFQPILEGGAVGFDHIRRRHVAAIVHDQESHAAVRRRLLAGKRFEQQIERVGTVACRHRHADRQHLPCPPGFGHVAPRPSLRLL
jgi:hypothetical protein